MTKQGMPAVSVLTPETIEEFKTTDDVVIVGYFAADDRSSNTTYSSVAENLRDDFVFGATNDAALAAAAGVEQPAIVLFKTFDEGKSVFSEKFSADAITEFAKVASTPLVGEVGPETYAGYMSVSSVVEGSRGGATNIPLGWYSSRLHLLRDSRRTIRTRKGLEACC